MEEKVCPYNGFACCYEKGCPAYNPKLTNTFCSLVQLGISPISPQIGITDKR